MSELSFGFMLFPPQDDQVSWDEIAPKKGEFQANNALPVSG